MKTYQVTVNGVAYNVTVEEAAPGSAPMPVAQAPIAQAPTFIPAPAAPVAAPVAAPAAAPAPATGGAEGASAIGNTRVESPLPGTVLDFKARIGDAVKKGQVLALIEAMKMENEIVSPADGTVASVNAERGDTVNPGDLLMTLNA